MHGIPAKRNGDGIDDGAEGPRILSADRPRNDQWFLSVGFVPARPSLKPEEGLSRRSRCLASNLTRLLLPGFATLLPGKSEL